MTQRDYRVYPEVWSDNPLIRELIPTRPSRPPQAPKGPTALIREREIAQALWRGGLAAIDTYELPGLEICAG